MMQKRDKINFRIILRHSNIIEVKFNKSRRWFHFERAKHFSAIPSIRESTYLFHLVFCSFLVILHISDFLFLLGAMRFHQSNTLENTNSCKWRGKEKRQVKNKTGKVSVSKANPKFDFSELQSIDRQRKTKLRFIPWRDVGGKRLLSISLSFSFSFSLCLSYSFSKIFLIRFHKYRYTKYNITCFTSDFNLFFEIYCNVVCLISRVWRLLIRLSTNRDRYQCS